MIFKRAVIYEISLFSLPSEIPGSRDGILMPKQCLYDITGINLEAGNI